MVVRRAVRFLIPLIGGLAMLAIIGYAVLTRTTSRWFEKDLALRSRLAIDSARTSLASHWNSREQLAGILGDITRDERIMAAAACSARDELLVATEAYPAGFTCAHVNRQMLDDAGIEASWSTTAELASGSVRVSATRLVRDRAPMGTIVL